MAKISVFGDSFAIGHPIQNHWVGQIAKHHNVDTSDVVNTAFGGSGIIDAIMQFTKHINDVRASNILIFVWSQPSRLYHPEVRDINSGSCLHPDHQQYKNKKLYNDALTYYENFYYAEIEELKINGVFEWFDRVLLENFSDKKILHFQSFSAGECKDNVMQYNFKSGINVCPALMVLSENEPEFTGLGLDSRSGHFSQYNHDHIFRTLIQYWNTDSGDNILLDDNYMPTYTKDVYASVWRSLTSKIMENK
jgi:hypothetical protein